MRRIFQWMAFGLVASLILSACPRHQASPEGAMTTSPVSIASKPGEENQKGGDYSLGVPECDQFFKKYEACIVEKIPPEARTDWRSNYERMVAQLHHQYELDHDSVKEACKIASNDIRQATASFHCEW